MRLDEGRVLSSLPTFLTCKPAVDDIASAIRCLPRYGKLLAVKIEELVGTQRLFLLNVALAFIIRLIIAHKINGLLR